MTMEDFVLPQTLEKFAGAGLAGPAKMMTAKGLAPLKPHDMVTCVYAMTLDTDENVSKTAKDTFKNFPETILLTAVNTGLPEQVLDAIVKSSEIDPVIEAVTLSAKTHNNTILYLAEKGSTRVVDIISNNQTRLLDCPEILDALGKNPLTGAAVVDRLFAFLQREGMISENLDEETPEISVEEFTAGMDTFDMPDDFELPEELITELQEEIPEEEDARSLFGKVLGMSVMEKIKLALKGNKEARSILIRDNNKLVSTAVIKSPKISEDEVIAIAGSKTVGDNVLRLINQKKEWRRIYRVQLGLATNPKTPFDIAMRMLKMLRFNDIRQVAKSKSVPNAIAVAAKRMVQQKMNAK